ncbi:MAG TPA: lipid A biosynthesis lauroyl acyltransferase, partial [Xanthobacteraceae bacterium]|nr:lipid A biosynthesis lauroyl acyltransferase [Xanthobacteraceae bacterium]
MASDLTLLRRRFRIRLAKALDKMLAILVASLLCFLRRLPRNSTSNLFGSLLRRIGPWMPEQRIGEANLKAAFPEKSQAEIEEILRGVWENLGRVAAEFAQVDRIAEGDPENRPHID